MSHLSHFCFLLLAAGTIKSAQSSPYSNLPSSQRYGGQNNDAYRKYSQSQTSTGSAYGSRTGLIPTTSYSRSSPYASGPNLPAYRKGRSVETGTSYPVGEPSHSSTSSGSSASQSTSYSSSASQSTSYGSSASQPTYSSTGSTSNCGYRSDWWQPNAFSQNSPTTSEISSLNNYQPSSTGTEYGQSVGSRGNCKTLFKPNDASSYNFLRTYTIKEAQPETRSCNYGFEPYHAHNYNWNNNNLFHQNPLNCYAQQHYPISNERFSCASGTTSPSVGWNLTGLSYADISYLKAIIRQLIAEYFACEKQNDDQNPSEDKNEEEEPEKDTVINYNSPDLADFYNEDFKEEESGERDDGDDEAPETTNDGDDSTETTNNGETESTDAVTYDETEKTELDEETTTEASAYTTEVSYTTEAEEETYATEADTDCHCNDPETTISDKETKCESCEADSEGEGVNEAGEGEGY